MEQGLTNETDTSVGSSLALLAGWTQEGTDDTHADRSTSDTGEEQLSSSDVVDNSGTCPISLESERRSWANYFFNLPVRAPNIEVQELTKLS